MHLPRTVGTGPSRILVTFEMSLLAWILPKLRNCKSDDRPEIKSVAVEDEESIAAESVTVAVDVEESVADVSRGFSPVDSSTFPTTLATRPQNVSRPFCTRP